MNEKVFEQLLHRLDLLEKTHADVDFKHTEQQDYIKAIKQSLKTEKETIRNELTSMKEECNNLHNALFKLGAALKEKTLQRDVDTFKEQLDNWQLEDFISKKELEPSFNRYSK